MELHCVGVGASLELRAPDVLDFFLSAPNHSWLKATSRGGGVGALYRQFRISVARRRLPET